ncbi:MAG: hydantoinase B/oxoprolinase family protein, partial [Porticoccaceae bacterium]|nr:hydantoinase B/oxoprolinase family protein [Porticoccaceae bacterium]
MSKWQFWVDRGGTFTDLIARTPQGYLTTTKLLSENPQNYDDAVLQGICELMAVAAVDDIPHEQIDCVRLGTTVATNALLERKGSPTLLVTTRGFGDVLKIGYQNRPDLFALNIQLPEPLYDEVLEVEERLAADGSIVTALDASTYTEQFRQAFARGLKSVAVVFMHAYRNPVHELAIGEIARRVGFTQVSLSHQASALIKFVGRGDTTVVDAYVSPVLQTYMQHLQNKLPGTRLLFMQSNGGLTDAENFHGRNSLLSGPAGGMVGGVQTSMADGFNKVLGFDMGGTSTDVWHFSGAGQAQAYEPAYERVYETTLAGVRLRVPMLDIHTVAAGGGSICCYDGSRFRVGPESAGASPGPACYGRGGPLTLTDCNLVLGKLALDHFPQVFGDSGCEPLDTQAADQRIEEIAASVMAETGELMSPQVLAEGFIDIAVEGMAAAIKKVSTERGHDVSDYALACFGGAAGQHACRVAERLGVETVLIHPLAGVLSALGMGLAEIATQSERSLEWPLTKIDLNVALAEVIVELKDQLKEQLLHGGVGEIQWLEKVSLRYQGSNTLIAVSMQAPEQMQLAFERAHLDQFSFLQKGRGLVVDSISVEALVPGAAMSGEFDAIPGARISPANTSTQVVAEQEEQVQLYSRGECWTAPLLAREALVAEQVLIGPALVIDSGTTTVIEPGWQAAVLASGSLKLSLGSAASPQQPATRNSASVGNRPSRKIATERNPVQLEIFNYRFMSIAEQMGAVLAKTAHSINIKERFDFSCALFDGGGNLVANAPHVPVHLGSMGETVVQLIAARCGTFQPGEAYLVNSPYTGGTHLPDLTVVTPVFVSNNGAPTFFVATRAHHADIGGITPGSIPPDSTSIEQEGVLFENFQLLSDGDFQVEELTEKLASGDYPARNIEQNIADLQAQVAANVLGNNELQALVREYGLDVVAAYMGYVQDNAEEAVRRVITGLDDGHCLSVMDNDAAIEVAIRVNRKHRRLVIDFTGTSAQQSNNFNAPASICKAAVLYVLRTLVVENIPLNAGCLRPVDIIIPEGS